MAECTVGTPYGMFRHTTLLYSILSYPILEWSGGKGQGQGQGQGTVNDGFAFAGTVGREQELEPHSGLGPK